MRTLTVHDLVLVILVLGDRKLDLHELVLHKLGGNDVFLEGIRLLDDLDGRIRSTRTRTWRARLVPDGVIVRARAVI